MLPGVASCAAPFHVAAIPRLATASRFWTVPTGSDIPIQNPLTSWANDGPYEGLTGGGCTEVVGAPRYQPLRSAMRCRPCCVKQLTPRVLARTMACLAIVSSHVSTLRSDASGRATPDGNAVTNPPIID